MVICTLKGDFVNQIKSLIGRICLLFFIFHCQGGYGVSHAPCSPKLLSLKPFIPLSYIINQETKFLQQMLSNMNRVYTFASPLSTI